MSWIKKITSIKTLFFIFSVSVVMMFLFTLFEGKKKFTNTENLSNVDAISFQISLLEIIITTVSIGGGLLAFLGWREIKQSMNDEINKTAEQFTKDNIHTIADIVLNKIREEIREEYMKNQESGTLEKSSIEPFIKGKNNE